jgi:ATP-dependent DNA helicase RecG
MALPINIEELIGGKTVEWERLEFKRSWNPLDVIQSVCAFANDFNNWGGGYIVIGIDEIDGMPVFPPAGVSMADVDTIQKELVNLCHKMIPTYFPIMEPVEYSGKTILVIWVPGGQVRPYRAPDGLGKVNKSFSYYIRHFSSTKKATEQETQDLIKMSAKVPYDDQINQNSEITDLSLTLIKSHLAKIGSALVTQADNLEFVELCRKMNIVDGADEQVKPKNIGLLIFNSNPTSFFPCARIDLISFKDDVGDTFSEKLFEGPIQQQLEDALLYIKNNVIVEKVIKIPGEAKVKRLFNYPYEAIEEAIANTVYHRSYEDDSPIEIRIFPTRIEMVSYPGPLPPLTKIKLLSGEKIIARKYRNRRIGDFLKELHLTEGRGTGIPKIRKSMISNGSPEPLFETDDDLSYFLVNLEIHPDWDVQDSAQDGAQDGVQDEIDTDHLILNLCLRPRKRTEVLAALKLYDNYRTFVLKTKHLLDAGYLERTIPDKPNSKNQQYRTTPRGEFFLHGVDEDIIDF